MIRWPCIVARVDYGHALNPYLLERGLGMVVDAFLHDSVPAGHPETLTPIPLTPSYHLYCMRCDMRRQGNRLFRHDGFCP